MSYAGVGFVFEAGGMHQIVTTAQEARAIYDLWRGGNLPDVLADSNAQYPWGLRTKTIICVGLFAIDQSKVMPGDVKSFQGATSGV